MTVSAHKAGTGVDCRAPMMNLRHLFSMRSTFSRWTLLAVQYRVEPESIFERMKALQKVVMLTRSLPHLTDDDIRRMLSDGPILRRRSSM